MHAQDTGRKTSCKAFTIVCEREINGVHHRSSVGGESGKVLSEF